jgi:hypothetical protein
MTLSSNIFALFSFFQIFSVPAITLQNSQNAVDFITQTVYALVCFIPCVVLKAGN